jgi:hypothetical protein
VAMRCESCGAELAPADVSCGQCGARVVRASRHPSFEAAEREFFVLKGKLASGLLTDEEYPASLNGLVVRDEEGRPWMIGAETGHWYYHDGAAWIRSEPPGAEALPPARRLSPWLLMAGFAALVILLCLGSIPILWLNAPEAAAPPGSTQAASLSTRTPPGGPTPTLAPSPTPPATSTQMPTIAPTGTPSVRGVVFAAGVSGGTEPVDTATEFPEGTTTVYAFANYAGMSSGAHCESVWYRDGEEEARTSIDWALGDSGQTWIDLIQKAGGLPSGRYNWELHIEGELFAGGAFTVDQPGAEIPAPPLPATATRAPSTATPVPPTPTTGPTEFDPIIFGKGLTEEADPIFPTTTFPSGTTEVFAVWACRGMYPGLELLAKWYHDGQDYTASSIVWEQEGERGRWWLHLHRASGAPLPGGNYRLELHVHGQLLQTGAFSIQ